MPRGDKSAYTDKQKRKAEHIEERYEERGRPRASAPPPALVSPIRASAAMTLSSLSVITNARAEG